MSVERTVNNNAIIVGGEVHTRMHRGSITGLVSFITNMKRYRNTLMYDTVGYLVSEPIYIRDQHYINGTSKVRRLDCKQHYPISDGRLIRYVEEINNYINLSNTSANKIYYDHSSTLDESVVYIPKAIYVVDGLNKCYRLNIHPHTLLWLANVYEHCSGDRPCPIPIGAILFELDFNYDRESYTLTKGDYGNTINIPETLRGFFSMEKPNHMDYHVNIEHHPHAKYLKSMYNVFCRDLGIVTASDLAKNISYIGESDE